MTRLLFLTWFGLASVGLFPTTGVAEDPIFSGPQVGEKLAPFVATGVLDKHAGKKVDVIKQADGGPILLVFVHQITRPSIGLLRSLFDYAKTKKGMTAQLVFLASDRTEMEARIRRARHALPKGTQPLISVDGVEGPGAYGLHRKMTLTVLVGNKNKVVGNFPLIQPSIQADAPKIGHAMVRAMGGKKSPTLKEMGIGPRGMMAAGARSAQADAIYRRMMGPVIRKQASKEDVDKAAKAVEAMAQKNKAFRDRVGRAAGMITGSGKLANYGTKHAQEYLKKWAKEYAPAEPSKRKDAANKKKSTDKAKKESSTAASDDKVEKKEAAKVDKKAKDTTAKDAKSTETP